VTTPRTEGVPLALVRARPVEQPFLVSFGGGVNSVALLIGLHQHGLRPDAITFADTGGEKPGTYRVLAQMDRWLTDRGWPAITVVRTVGVRTGDKSLEDACRRLEIMPSRTVGLGTCALRWKKEPQEKWLRHWPAFKAAKLAGFDKVIRAIGYDAGEARRAKYFEDDMTVYTFPLMEWGWDRERCEAEAVLEGFHDVTKSACFFCPSSTKTEVIELAQRHPDLFQRAVDMERAALASGKMHSVKGLGRHWSWEALVKASDRSCFIENPVEGCLTCAAGGGWEEDE